MGVGVAGVANYCNTSSGTASDVVAYGGVGGPYEYVSFFSVLNWFAAGEQGAWYDPSDFQPNWRRNLLTYTEDFSNAAWNKGNGTIAGGVPAPDGTTSAFSFSAYGDLATLTQSITRSAVPYVFTIYLKVAAISGDVGISVDGVNYVVKAISDVWTRFDTLVTSTAGVVYCGIQVANTGDVVNIWHPQLEQSSSPSTYQKITNGIQDYYTVQPQPVLFQDSAGTTPVTAVEQPVGLMLDKSKGLALGAELVGSTFSGVGNLDGWALTSGSINNNGINVANITASSTSNELLTKTISSFIVGNTYYVSCDFISGTYLKIGIITLATTGTSTQGKYSYYFTATATTHSFVVYAAGANSSVTLDNISVKQIAGNHAFQALDTKRPMLSARVNLLTKTEDFSNAVWSILQASKTPNYGIAPDGSQAACRFVSTVSGSYGLLYQLVPYAPIAGASYTLTIWVKSNTASSQVFRLYAQGGVYSAPITATTTWQMFTFPATSSGVNTSWGIENSTGSGYSDIDLLVWHPDLRPTNAGALLPPYQRVNTASDYDTVGFPLYLKANGTSSAMSTNSIDFSSTDKMTVVTGVRKLSDAVQVILEYSSSWSLNQGSFFMGNGFSTDPTAFISGSGGTAFAAVISPTSMSSPISKVLASTHSITPASITLRANGTQLGSSTASQGIGNFGNYPLYLFARAGSVIPINGQFYGAIIRGAQSDTASVTQTENYMAQKTGITF